MIKKIITGIFIGSLLFVSTNIKAAPLFKDKQVVDSNKEWTIHFNQEVAFDDLSKQGIAVIDSKGNNANAVLNLGQDNKSIIVSAPSSEYKAGEKYKLIINNKVHSKNSKNIKQDIVVNFSVKDDIVTFKDSNVEKAIRNSINKPTGDLLKSDVENITDLTLDDRAIKDISGIENLINLKKLYLDRITINNLDALKNLSNLESLRLEYVKLGDMTALENMINLKYLYLDGMNIKDISLLKNLTNLEDLTFDGDIELSDISPLKGLIKLKDVSFLDCPIKDISPLKDLINLKFMQIDGIQVSNSDRQALKNAIPNCEIWYIGG